MSHCGVGSIALSAASTLKVLMLGGVRVQKMFRHSWYISSSILFVSNANFHDNKEKRGSKCHPL